MYAPDDKMCIRDRLPVINAFIIRIPRQTAALQPMAACHEIDFRRALADSGVVILVLSLIHIFATNVCASFSDHLEKLAR